MNKITIDFERDLDLIICQKEKISPNLAMKWKWRILNEYPDDLKNLVLAWAKGEQLPEIEYNGISFERIMNSVPMSFLDSIDLLYILYKDPIGGYEIFSKSIRRDPRRR